MTTKVWGDTTAPIPDCLKHKETTTVSIPTIDHLCASIVHSKTSKAITKYQRLADNPDHLLRETQCTGFGKKFGNMAQGHTKNGTPGHVGRQDIVIEEKDSN